LGRPYVTKRLREDPELAAAHPVVVRDKALHGDVVLVEAEPRRTHLKRPDSLAGPKALKRGNLDLDHEAPARLQMRGNVLEALNLFVLGGEVLDRVVHEVGERERPAHPGGREVAD